MKNRNTLVIANVVLVVSLWCSLFLREGSLQGSDILDLTDAISFFGILTWLLIGALWLVEQARGGHADARQDGESQPSGKTPMESSRAVASNPVIPARSEVEGASDLKPLSLSTVVARCGGSLLSLIAIAAVAFTFYQVFAKGIILWPLFTWAYWVPLLGGQLIFRHCANRLSRLGCYLLLAVAAGSLFAVILSQTYEKVAYLSGYAVEAAICMVALLARDLGRVNQAG